MQAVELRGYNRADEPRCGVKPRQESTAGQGQGSGPRGDSPARATGGLVWLYAGATLRVPRPSLSGRSGPPGTGLPPSPHGNQLEKMGSLQPRPPNSAPSAGASAPRPAPHRLGGQRAAPSPATVGERQGHPKQEWSAGLTVNHWVYRSPAALTGHGAAPDDFALSLYISGYKASTAYSISKLHRVVSHRLYGVRSVGTRRSSGAGEYGSERSISNRPR